MTSPDAPSVPPSARTDRSPWNWLLIIPIVVPLLTPLFNIDSPRLWGFPAFYWLQFLFILFSVALTATVYQLTSSRFSARSAVSVDE
jgi:hypothetical protein